MLGNIGRTDHEFRLFANCMWLILDWALIRNIVTDRDIRLMVLIRNTVTNINMKYIDRADKKYYKFTIRDYTTGCVGDITRLQHKTR